MMSVSGTPSALPDKPAKLERMSLRTTPLAPSTLGPFDPSPGYGPCVSSGILVVHTLPLVVVVELDVVVALGEVLLFEQPTSCSALTPAPSRAAIRNRCRRF